MLRWPPSGLVVGQASYRRAQHLDGSVMGHRWRCNADNEGVFTDPQGRPSGKVNLDVLCGAVRHERKRPEVRRCALCNVNCGFPGSVGERVTEWLMRMAQERRSVEGEAPPYWGKDELAAQMRTVSTCSANTGDGTIRNRLPFAIR